MARVDPEAVGRVTLTFPHAAPGKAIPAWGITIHDYDTGEQLLDVFKLAMVLGSDQSFDEGPIHVDLTRIVDGEGNPVNGKPVGRDSYTDEFARHLDENPDTPFDGPVMRTRVFRYLVVGPSPFAQLASSVGLGPSNAVASLRKGDEIVIRGTDGSENRMRIIEVRGELPGHMEVNTEPATASDG